VASSPDAVHDCRRSGTDMLRIFLLWLSQPLRPNATVTCVDLATGAAKSIVLGWIFFASHIFL
jgi:hypothetical protein